MTLLETLISVTILSVLMAAVLGLFVALARLEKNNRMTVRYATMAHSLETTLRKYCTDAFQFIDEGGNGVRIVRPDGLESIMRFVDEDGDWRTLADNSIIFISADEPDSEQLIAVNVSRVDAWPNAGDRPVFRLLNNNGGGAPDAFSALIIEFQMGDYTSDPDAPCHALTGPGFQNLPVRTAISPRNHQEGA